jgi:hypothetical protein
MQINIFYNQYTGEYVANEKGDFTTSGVTGDNIKTDLEELLNFVLYKYHKRKAVLMCRLSEKDLEFAQKYVSRLEAKMFVESD